MILNKSLIEEVITKKDCKESSKKKYKRDLTNLKQDYLESKDYSFLLCPKQVIKHLKEKYKNISTLKSKIISIYTVLKDLEIDEEIIKDYKDFMNFYRDENNNKIKENKPTKKQQDNKITFEEIREKVKVLNKEISFKTNIKYSKNKRKVNKLLKKISDYITLVFLCNRPPTRLEIYNIYFTEEKIEKTKDNYISFKEDYCIYHLNDYKNITKLGPREITLSKELTIILRDYYTFLKLNELKKNDKYYLFSNFVKGKISRFSNPCSFSKYVKTLFKKYFKKETTMNDLRHIYTTDFMMESTYALLSINEKEKLHNRLLHNKETGEEYFKLYKRKKEIKNISYTDKEKIQELLKKINYKLID